jgi:hypothetical protein
LAKAECKVGSVKKHSDWRNKIDAQWAAWVAAFEWAEAYLEAYLDSLLFGPQESRGSEQSASGNGGGDGGAGVEASDSGSGSGSGSGSDANTYLPNLEGVACTHYYKRMAALRRYQSSQNKEPMSMRIIADDILMGEFPFSANVTSAALMYGRAAELGDVHSLMSLGWLFYSGTESKLASFASVCCCCCCCCFANVCM